MLKHTQTIRRLLYKGLAILKNHTERVIDTSTQDPSFRLIITECKQVMSWQEVYNL